MTIYIYICTRVCMYIYIYIYICIHIIHTHTHTHTFTHIYTYRRICRSDPHRPAGPTTSFAECHLLPFDVHRVRRVALHLALSSACPLYVAYRPLRTYELTRSIDTSTIYTCVAKTSVVNGISGICPAVLLSQARSRSQQTGCKVQADSEEL